MSAQPPAAQPVARPIAWYRADRGWFMGNEHGREFGPAWTPLYATPDPRIAQLEGLLREAKERIEHSAIHGFENQFCEGCQLVDRIEAALKEGA